MSRLLSSGNKGSSRLLKGGYFLAYKLGIGGVWLRRASTAEDRICVCLDRERFYAGIECVDRWLDPFVANLVVAAGSGKKDRPGERGAPPGLQGGDDTTSSAVTASKAGKSKRGELFVCKASIKSDIADDMVDTWASCVLGIVTVTVPIGTIFEQGKQEFQHANSPISPVKTV